jgi:hypothetical protein
VVQYPEIIFTKSGSYRAGSTVKEPAKTALIDSKFMRPSALYGPIAQLTHHRPQGDTSNFAVVGRESHTASHQQR